MREEIGGTPMNDIANQFIYSGLKFYLRQKTDSYILFSPIKYWKAQNLVSKKFNKGFIFNRKFFHAGASAITCIFWKNESSNSEQIVLEIFDINTKNTIEIMDDEIVKIGKTIINKTHNLFSAWYDKRNFNDDSVGIISNFDGSEYFGKTARLTPKYNKNIIGYMEAAGFTFENPRLKTQLARIGLYDGNGFYLRSDNYLEKLPLFTAGKYPIENKWYENGVIYRSSDGGNKYIKDKDFLKSCFIFTCLSRYNKCLSFAGSDKRFYKNELCFDKNTLASKQLLKFKLNSDEKELIKIWQGVLAEVKKEAKNMKKYNKKFSYGPYQIEMELNTSYKDENNKIIYDHPTLNGELENLKKKLKAYYAKHITPKLFRYELLK